LYKIPARTLFTGKRLIYVPECHSTNDLATQILDQSLAHEGTVVITDRQLRGRGQRGNAWVSADYLNITLSVVLRPTFLSLQDQFYLNIVASLAVRDTVLQFVSVPAFVKWPNDVIARNGKIAGILIENQLHKSSIQASVVGIGLNVNQTAFDIPSATSLALQAGQLFDNGVVFEVLMECLEARYLVLRQGKLNLLRQAYYDVLYGRGEIRRFAAGGREFSGTITGVDALGQLQVDSGGTTTSYSMQEIRYLN
jgi:BirA family biotin operon repressor/biotin-[acetyl-CoA-carboxylase] ligase